MRRRNEDKGMKNVLYLDYWKKIVLELIQDQDSPGVQDCPEDVGLEYYQVVAR